MACRLQDAVQRQLALLGRRLNMLALLYVARRRRFSNPWSGILCRWSLGVTFTGRAWSEPTLLRLACAFEQAIKTRRLPNGLPLLDGNFGS
jgi:Asp-tRNA(Asn)/Glu-tRNA(Gln) amidotransferase A subunit family amidase